MRLLSLLSVMLISIASYSQTATLKGRVLDRKTKTPIEFAAVVLGEGTGVGSVSDSKGSFRITNVSIGEYILKVSCLGYVTQNVKVYVSKAKTNDVTVYLPEMSLAIDEVTVTARRKTEDATTAYTIGRTALDHLQAVSVADVMSLLPGERTNNSFKLTDGSSHAITLRGASGEDGTPGFGTVVEIDGARVSTNGVTKMAATDTRSIASNNIESIEVVTGVPSVEYGDLTNGVVKVKTFRGKTPFMIEAGVRPNTQVYSFSKGFDLGKKKGVINASYERARSTADLASPYTSYVRNAITLKYSNTFRTARHKLVDFDWSVNGNIGGYNSKSDPDAYRETYTKYRDNALRSSLSVNYLANSPWLSSLNAGVSVSYSDTRTEGKVAQSAASAQPSMHSTVDGYFVGEKYDENPNASIVLLPVGYYYYTGIEDSKPLNYRAFLKARWSHRFGKLSSHLLLGSEFKGDGNLGRGEYYDDVRTAPTWREYRYDDLPFTNNLSLYAEEELRVQFPHSHLRLKAGVRQDMTFIKQSIYGTVSSLSPRFNASYTFAENPDAFVKSITFRAGWGKAVKLPSFDMLYPRTTYVDRLAFAPGTMADGTTYYAYHTETNTAVYNPDLKWQYNIMRELGIDARLKGVRMQLSFYYNTMRSPYSSAGKMYLPFSYKLTTQTALEGCTIPSADRRYEIDQTTGVVTVHDKTGANPSQELGYTVINDWKTRSYSINSSPSKRIGLEWVLDFDRIKSLNTSVRLDGKYYYYRSAREEIIPSSSTLTSADGQPYKYVGYYVGGASASNGMETRNLNTNLTITTHIPRIRMIFSLRVEGTFMRSQQRLSEYGGVTRSYVLDSQSSNLPSAAGGSIYGGDKYVVTYPLYYTSRDDMNTQVPFLEKYLWASQNDKQLYNDLSKLLVKSTTGYIFKEWSYSPYFSANLNITKEIGKNVSLSFYANNFYDTLRKVKAHHTDTEMSLYNSAFVTPFNYGVSLKLKL